MPDVGSMLNELAEIADQPGMLLDRYLKDGRKVVGCFPVYTPEELVHAAGAIPMGLWGGHVAPTVAGKYSPIFTCSIMRSCLECGMTGKYKGLSAIVMPMLCDTFRGMSAAWRAGVGDIPAVFFIHPQNRKDSGAREFLVEEYLSVKRRLEEITGRTISDERLAESIEVYNAHSASMMKFCEVADEHLDIVTPLFRHKVMKSALFMEKGEHADKVGALVEGLAHMPRCEWKGKKVILTGITAEPDELLSSFEKNDIAVVGDDLAQESRLYRTLIPAGSCPVERLADQWFERYACSLIHETESRRGEMLVEMARKYGADGVVICLMRFCDVEEYDYPFISKTVQNAGFRTLCLEIDQSKIGRAHV